MAWKPLTNGREIDPDFYVEEGADAVYEETALARRVFGWNGRMFPRISLAAYEGWRNGGVASLKGDCFSLSCSYKSEQGQWWKDIDVPIALVDELAAIVADVKTKLSKPRDGR